MQIESLLTTGGDICGLNEIYFNEPRSDRGWRYRYPWGARPWVAGGAELVPPSAGSPIEVTTTGPVMQLSQPLPDLDPSLNGRTVTRALAPEQAERAREWFDNARRLLDLVDQLKQPGIEHAQTDDHWPDN